MLELPAPNAGIITQILKGGRQPPSSLVKSSRFIDTEASAQVSPLQVSSAPVQTAPAEADPVAAAVNAIASKANVAMPAAAKMLAENNLTT